MHWERRRCVHKGYSYRNKHSHTATIWEPLSIPQCPHSYLSRLFSIVMRTEPKPHPPPLNYTLQAPSLMPESHQPAQLQRLWPKFTQSTQPPSPHTSLLGTIPGPLSQCWPVCMQRTSLTLTLSSLLAPVHHAASIQCVSQCEG